MALQEGQPKQIKFACKQHQKRRLTATTSEHITTAPHNPESDYQIWEKVGDDSSFTLENKATGKYLAYSHNAMRLERDPYEWGYDAERPHMYPKEDNSRVVAVSPDDPRHVLLKEYLPHNETHRLEWNEQQRLLYLYAVHGTHGLMGSRTDTVSTSQSLWDNPPANPVQVSERSNEQCQEGKTDDSEEISNDMVDDGNYMQEQEGLKEVETILGKEDYENIKQERSNEQCEEGKSDDSKEISNDMVDDGNCMQEQEGLKEQAKNLKEGETILGEEDYENIKQDDSEEQEQNVMEAQAILDKDDDGDIKKEHESLQEQEKNGKEDEVMLDNEDDININQALEEGQPEQPELTCSKHRDRRLSATASGLVTTDPNKPGSTYQRWEKEGENSSFTLKNKATATYLAYSHNAIRLEKDPFYWAYDEEMWQIYPKDDNYRALAVAHEDPRHLLLKQYQTDNEAQKWETNPQLRQNAYASMST